jgi:hypothetical protein
VNVAQFKAVYPVSDEDTNALPVKNLGPAIAFYQSILGFLVVGRDDSTAVLARDEVRIGLIQKADHEPGKAGSLAFEINDLEKLHQELHARGANPGEFGIDEWNGKRYRTFFLREAENGYCYCFYRPDRGTVK